MSHATRIAILASGRGSNFQALLDASRIGLFDANFVGVFGDRPDAAVLERAREAGIATWSRAPATFADRSSFDDALFDALARVQPELIVMAGFMRIVGDSHVRRWRGHMINIHPSLLPKYPGLHTHGRALRAGDTEHGATVHFVTPELDGGPPIAQARVPVLAGDTAAALRDRVLAREHPLLVATVARIAAGAIQLDGEVVRYQGHALNVPLQLAADGALQEPTVGPGGAA